MNRSIFEDRSLGILLHPTSLPGGSYCGTFGKGAIDWLKILSIHKIKNWQFLPLSPTDSTGSPYSSPSSFALNPWFLDIQELINDGLVDKSKGGDLKKFEIPTLDYFEFNVANKLSNLIGEMLIDSWSYQSESKKNQFYKWLKVNRWVDEYSIFMVLREEFEMLPWWKWPQKFRNKNSDLLHKWCQNNHKKLLTKKLVQWQLNNQWLKIKDYAKSLGIKLIGDLPFYVSRDSVDVWSNKELFSVSNNGDLIFQSGVPPDYFSSTGQLWGTPVYYWSKHVRSKFDWWKKRFKRQYELVDILRLDHFRALAGYWRVDGKAQNAIVGKWINSPGFKLLKSLKDYLNVDRLPIIAEDLGLITEDVNILRNKFYLPGMKILQFAFDGNNDNPYLPKNFEGDNWVVYTGTHDNSTTLSWWEELDSHSREKIKDNYEISSNPSWELIEIGLRTDARLFIAPLQDILSLDDASRTNKPGTVSNNWKWKLNKSLFDIDIYLDKYGALGKTYCRDSNN